jgi:hypothetical protein
MAVLSAITEESEGLQILVGCIHAGRHATGKEFDADGVSGAFGD